MRLTMSRLHVGPQHHRRGARCCRQVLRSLPEGRLRLRGARCRFGSRGTAAHEDPGLRHQPMRFAGAARLLEQCRGAAADCAGQRSLIVDSQVAGLRSGQPAHLSRYRAAIQSERDRAGRHRPPLGGDLSRHDRQCLAGRRRRLGRAFARGCGARWRMLRLCRPLSRAAC